MFNCELISGKTPPLPTRSVYFVKDQQNLILIEFDIELVGFVKVVRCIRLKRVEAQLDRAEPRKLEIVVKTITTNGKVNKLGVYAVVAATNPYDCPTNRKSSRTSP